METNKFEIFNKLSSEEIIFDVETTGLKKDHDNIIEFAAEDLKTDAHISFRMKKRKETIAAPGALITTGRSFKELRKDAISQYDAAQKIRTIFEKMSVIYGHNVTFDRAFIAQNQFMNGHFAYQLSCNNRIIIDTLHLFSMASHFSDKFIIPLVEGKRSHKLEHVFSANFTDEFSAHMASADVSATKQLLLKVKNAAPRLWDARKELFSKAERTTHLRNPNGFLAYYWHNWEFKRLFGAYHSKSLSLVIDPDELPNDIDSVKAQLQTDERPKFIKQIYPSLMQPITSLDRFPELHLKFKEPNMEFLEVVKGLVRKSKFIHQAFPKKTYLENQAFGFPDDIDRENWDKFHALDNWKEKAEVEFITVRSKRLRRRILFEEAPEFLTEDVVKMMKKTIKMRWLAGDGCPWLTIDEAISSIDQQKVVDLNIAEYRRYLVELKELCFSFENAS